MTAATAALGADVEIIGPGFGFDEQAWIGWLRDRLDPAWRLDEWDPATLLFSGDYRKELTGLWKCDVVACPLASHCKGICETCTKHLKTSGADREEFIRTWVPLRRGLSVDPDTCMVTRDGIRCLYPTIWKQMCLNHSGMWRHYVTSTAPREGLPPLSALEWATRVAVPYTDPPPDCQVVGCERAGMNYQTLCAYHYRRWGRFNQHRDEPVTAEWWARQQIPFLGAARFSMAVLTPLVRAEVLYCLQRRDAAGKKLYPRVLRKLTGFLEGVATLQGQQEHLTERFDRDANGNSFIRSVYWYYGLAVDEFHGVAPRDKDQLDLVAIGLKGVNGRTKSRRNWGVADLTVISQPWLRTLLREWAVEQRPNSSDFHRVKTTVTIASQALRTRPDGGQDVGALGFGDINAVVEGLRCATKREGKLYSAKYRGHMMTWFFDLLEFGRIAGLLDELPGIFARHSTHIIRDEESNEDEVGSAIPEYVIGQLDAQLDRIGAEMVYGALSPERIHQMFKTIYVIFRDTGRRPLEVASLRRDCLETIDGEVALLWDNGKGRRLRRRLPITAGTAQVIREWQVMRAEVPAPSRSTDYLFPAITDAAGFPHMESGYSGTAFRSWVDALPHLWSDAPGPDGQPQEFDRSRIYPYAFRHSYAQRHADAGTPVDVLRQLMDHVSVNTTMGYYTVSLKRKRAAVKTLAAHVLDRNGHPAPFGSELAYQRGSVAVPFGGCVEPNNVKAGGNACPIRFQCAGCGHYRPDPSYLAALEQHLNDLKADRETARAMDAAAFVIDNLTDQIRAFSGVADSMRTKLAQLPADERAEVEEAAAVMRKTRAADGRARLPLTVLSKESQA